MYKEQAQFQRDGEYQIHHRLLVSVLTSFQASKSPLVVSLRPNMLEEMSLCKQTQNAILSVSY